MTIKGKSSASISIRKITRAVARRKHAAYVTAIKPLQAKGFEIIGVSKDSAKSHQGFIQKQNLPFRLIADTDTTLQEQFGVGLRKNVRTFIHGDSPTTFIINEEGIVTNIIGPKEVKTKDHANQILNL